MARWAVPGHQHDPSRRGCQQCLRALVPERVYVTLNEAQRIFSWTSQAEDMDPLDYAEGAAEVSTIW